MQFQIGPWQYIPEKCLIAIDDIERELEPLLVKLLDFFVAQPEVIHSRQTLIDEVWQQTFVDDNAINRAISELRKQLSHASHPQPLIKTHYRKGYSLAVKVEPIQPQEPSKPQITHNIPQVVESSLAAQTSQSADNRSPFIYVLAVLTALTLLIIGYFWTTSLTANKQQATESKQSAPKAKNILLSTATWQLGAASHPLVSPDKQYFAFNNRYQDQPKAFVKRLSDNLAVDIRHQDFSIALQSWQVDSSKLLAKLFHLQRQECFYATFDTAQFPTIVFERKIKKCDLLSDLQAQLDSTGQILYYATEDEQKIGWELRRFDISSGRNRILQPSNNAVHGVRHFELSADGEKILFRWEEQGLPITYYLYDLNSNEKRKLYEIPVDGKLTNITWYNADTAIIIKGDSLSLIDVESAIQTTYQLSQSLSPALISVISDKQLLVSEFGSTKYSLQQLQHLFTDPDQEPQDFLPSEGNSYFQRYFNDNLYFVSNRSGSVQYWRAIAGKPERLSDFNPAEKSVLYMPVVSNDEQQLLFRRSNVFEIMDIQTRQIRTLTDIDGRYVNTYHFSPDDKKMFYALTTNQVVQIWQYDLLTNQSKQLTGQGVTHLLRRSDGQVFYTQDNALIGLTVEYRREVPFEIKRCACALSLTNQYLYSTDGFSEIQRMSLGSGKQQTVPIEQAIRGLAVNHDDTSIIVTTSSPLDTQIKRLIWHEDK